MLSVQGNTDISSILPQCRGILIKQRAALAWDHIKDALGLYYIYIMHKYLLYYIFILY